MAAGLDFSNRDSAGCSTAHLGTMVRSARMLEQLPQKVTGGCRVVVAADVDRWAAEDATQETAGLRVSIEMSFRPVGGASRVFKRKIGHEVAPARRVKVLFRGLFVTIADLGGAVEGEASTAIHC